MQGGRGQQKAEGPRQATIACKDFRNPERSASTSKLKAAPGKVWTFREERHKIGRGPAASIGDADDFALGLGADEFEDATPRRRCILDSLSLEELDLVRSNPRWYLESMDSDFEDYDMSGNRERLIDFFTPARKDKNVSIECYAQRLRARLAAAEAQDLHDSVPSQKRSWQAFGES